MGIFNHLFCVDINRGVRNFQDTPGAVLLDVRAPQLYARRHIPGSRNVPLGTLHQAELPADPETPLFDYCLSGARSRQAALILRQAGYAHVTDLGGICNYHGKVVK